MAFIANCGLNKNILHGISAHLSDSIVFKSSVTDNGFSNCSQLGVFRIYYGFRIGSLASDIILRK